MKIIHSYDTWLPLTMSWLYNQVHYLPDEFKSHIACSNTENLDLFKVPGIHNHKNTSKPEAFLNLIMRKKGWLNKQVLNVSRKTDAQLLHSHFGHTAWENMRTARKAGLKHVVTFYGQDVNYLPVQRPIWRKRYRELFEHIDGVLCEGSFMKNCIIELGCHPDKITVHHLGVEINEIEYKPRSWKPGTPLKVLIAASFREKKGIPYAIRAFSAIQDKVDLEITIIGDSSREEHSKTEKQMILHEISKGRLQEKVKLLGFQPHHRMMEEAYHHHLFISPSVTASSGDTEGGAPISLIEMAASGMPLISTLHCDIPGVILHGKTGLLANERDTEGLVAHLSWLIEYYDDWENMLQKGRDHIQQNFDARIQGVKLGEYYKSIINQ
ncbi:MAG: glycosyltransferase [Balneolales bacterium]